MKIKTNLPPARLPHKALRRVCAWLLLCLGHFVLAQAGAPPPYLLPPGSREVSGGLIKLERRTSEKTHQQILEGKWEMRLLEHPYLTAYASRVGKDLEDAVQHLSKSDEVQLFIVDAEDPNAFATGQGRVYLHLGLLQTLCHADELAAVTAHEIAHNYHHHVGRGMRHQIGASIFSDFLAQILGNYSLVSDVVLVLKTLRYSRTHETEADLFGVYVQALAGYNPLSAQDLFEHFRQLSDRDPRGLEIAFRSHPPEVHRIEQVARVLEAFTAVRENRLRLAQGLMDRGYALETAHYLAATGIHLPRNFEQYVQRLSESRRPAYPHLFPKRARALLPALEQKEEEKGGEETPAHFSGRQRERAVRLYVIKNRLERTVLAIERFRALWPKGSRLPHAEALEAAWQSLKAQSQRWKELSEGPSKETAKDYDKDLSRLLRESRQTSFDALRAVILGTAAKLNKYDPHFLPRYIDRVFAFGDPPPCGRMADLLAALSETIGRTFACQEPPPLETEPDETAEKAGPGEEDEATELPPPADPSEGDWALYNLIFGDLAKVFVPPHWEER